MEWIKRSYFLNSEPPSSFQRITSWNQHRIYFSVKENGLAEFLLDSAQRLFSKLCQTGLFCCYTTQYLFSVAGMRQGRAFHWWNHPIIASNLLVSSQLVEVQLLYIGHQHYYLIQCRKKHSQWWHHSSCELEGTTQISRGIFMSFKRSA